MCLEDVIDWLFYEKSKAENMRSMQERCEDR